MTTIEMIFLLRQHLSDDQNVGWPEDNELLAFLDRAAGYLSDTLIAHKDLSILKKMMVDAETPLPDDFVMFVGNVPALVLGPVVYAYDDSFEALYWAKFPLPSRTNTVYERSYALLIVDIARMFALNKNEYDISQDMALLNDIRNTIAGARGGKQNAQTRQ